MEIFFDKMEYLLEGIKNTVIYFSSLIYNLLMYWHWIITIGVHNYIMPLIKNSNFPVLITFLTALMLQIIFLPAYISNFRKNDTFLTFAHMIIILVCNFYFGSIFQEQFKSNSILLPTGINLYAWYLLSSLASAIVFFYLKPKYDPYLKELLPKNHFHVYFQLITGFLFCTYSFYFHMPFLGVIFIVAMSLSEWITQLIIKPYFLKEKI